jgi:hypothetical protein
VKEKDLEGLQSLKNQDLVLQIRDLLNKCLHEPRAGLLLGAIKSQVETMMEIHARVQKEASDPDSYVQEMFRELTGFSPEGRLGDIDGDEYGEEDDGSSGGGRFAGLGSGREGGRPYGQDAEAEGGRLSRLGANGKDGGAAGRAEEVGREGGATFTGESVPGRVPDLAPGAGAAPPRVEAVPVGGPGRDGEGKDRLPAGVTVDVLLEAALAIAQFNPFAQADAAWKASVTPVGFGLPLAAEIVGGMAFRNLTERAEKSWKFLDAWKDRKTRKAAARETGSLRDGPPLEGTLYIELCDTSLLMGGIGPFGGEDVGCRRASAFFIPSPVQPSGAGPEALAAAAEARAAMEAGRAPATERVTVVGRDPLPFRKLVWDLALRHGYAGGRNTVVLMDGSKAASRTALYLFKSATQLLDFHELASRVEYCSSMLFEFDPKLRLLPAKRGVDREKQWTGLILGQAEGGDVDGALRTVAAALDKVVYSGSDCEVNDLLKFMKANRAGMNYRECLDAGLYTGNDSLERVQSGLLWDFNVFSKEIWGVESMQAAGTLMDKLACGLWERDVEAPLRELFGRRG